MPTDPATDRASLLALQQGEAAALNQLIVRWQRPLLSFAYRYVQNSTDAHDMVAETFVRLHQQRLRLRPDTKLAAWLFTTLTNLCHNHHRWKRRHPTVALGTTDRDDPNGGTSSIADLPGEHPAPDVALVHDEAVTAVRTAIDRLPHELKTAVLLHHYEHLSYREIAAIAGCSERGVETRLYRAKQQLRHALGAWLNETIAH